MTSKTQAAQYQIGKGSGPANTRRTAPVIKARAYSAAERGRYREADRRGLVICPTKLQTPLKLSEHNVKPAI